MTDNKEKFTIDDYKDFDVFLGRDCNFRIVNKNGDFGYVKGGTFTYWFAERSPLEQFQTQQ